MSDLVSRYPLTQSGDLNYVRAYTFSQLHLRGSGFTMERAGGFEPPTFSLEG